MNDIYSFYQLISKYQIEIPIIQRDYAQGRNNSKAADVRKTLVDNMIKAVKEDKSLFFDFVYGRVDNNKFIPFDGQQRLTTLFLFHKYIFEKCQSDLGCNHKDNCSCGDILGRFSYATRQSSREFCEKLVENNIIPDDKYKNQLRETFIAALKKEDNEKEKKADEFIKSIDNWIYRFVTNQPWFYPDWEKDPTVMGMLTMLDEIHCQMKKNETDFKTSDFKKFAEKLTSGCDCPITFHFVDMGEHKMSDETYVKMNARGKTLTPFENFKASLEQYLEEKSKTDLLNRWKGNYDEPKQITGIDGIWLDLFWKVANQGKEGAKELPDTLMMSFFNRHFMNVWRCWYANKSKSGKVCESLSDEDKNKQNEYDVFNDKIQNLFPTKDNFVSFDIYRTVMEVCGIERCLTPIFNIFDALSVPNNTIEKDCQAVWNRDEKEPKWNLYFGDKNKDNRETYPSRVAFYALMKYFTNNTDTANLTQWMRVVWNIIENSTIDSSDTYHAALRLIEKLSAKSHTIYNALANEFESFELGNQYHAQEQVAEEIVKATQILNGGQRTDGKTWEKIIIEAENYTFFKGAIRFLFTDGKGNINWCDFNTKWANAKAYFDENGVKKKTSYRDDALLMKSLLANCDDFWGKIWWHFEFSNDAIRWKRILTSNNWITAVDAIMGTEITDVVTSKFIDPYIKNIVDDGLMNYVCNEMSGAWIRSTYHNYHAIWQRGYPSYQIVLNPILARLKVKNNIEYSEKNKIENCRYYKCEDKNVDFKYGCHFFRWWGYSNEKKLDVCLMNDNWEGKKLKNQENSDTPENNFYFSVDEKETEESFLHKLDCLIAQAFPDTDKSVCLECKEKICQSTPEQ